MILLQQCHTAAGSSLPPVMRLIGHVAAVLVLPEGVRAFRMTTVEKPLVKLLALLIFLARITPTQISPSSAPLTQPGVRESRLVLNMSVAARIENESHYSAKLAQKDFEAGYNYQPAPVGTAQIGCAARSWAVIMDWGDGTFSEALSHEVPASEHGLTKPGVYPLFSQHRYLKLGSFDASLKLSVHCANKPDEIVTHEDFRIQVFDHVPVKTFASKSDGVHRGSPVEIALELETSAPKSGTRIFLKFTDEIGAFQSDLLPRFVDVQPGSNRARVEIPTLRTADAGTITVTAIGANGPHNVKVEIR
jgi:hypothetical protein